VCGGNDCYREHLLSIADPAPLLSHSDEELMRLAFASADICGGKHEGLVDGRSNANANERRKANEWRDTCLALTETTNIRILLNEINTLPQDEETNHCRRVYQWLMNPHAQTLRSVDRQR